MYLLEGNIGAGKSTLINILKKHLPHILHKEEPVNTWHGTPEQQGLLEHFYNDQKRWAYTMESFTLMSRIHELIKSKQEDTDSMPVVSERSFYSGFYCFAYLGYQNQTLSALEWKLYQQLFDFLVSSNAFTPKGFIYLATDPRVCHERINKRRRSGESEIPFDYLQALHDRHESFLVIEKNSNPLLQNVPVLYLDGSEEFEGNKSKIQELCQQIDIFIQKTHVSSVASSFVSQVVL